MKCSTASAARPCVYDDRDDDALFDAWQAGDRRAAAALVERSDAALRRFLRARVGADVDDVVQSVWSVISGCRERFERRSTFRAYLFGIARNLARETIRRRAAAKRHESIEIDAIATTDPAFELALDDARRVAQVHAAVSSLEGIARDVVECYYLDGMPARAVAVRLGIGPNTARSRVHRATARLRAALCGDAAPGQDTAEPLRASNGLRPPHCKGNSSFGKSVLAQRVASATPAFVRITCAPPSEVKLCSAQ